MNYNIMPSLDHMALIKIAITLFKQELRLTIQENLPLASITIKGRWQAIEDKAVKNVQQLTQPNVIKEKIVCIIKPISIEISSWLSYINDVCGVRDNILFIDEICWTAIGTINRKKTVELYIKNKEFDIKHLYNLACNLCIEDEIPKLWNSWSKCDREIFYSQKDVAYSHKTLLHYWKSVMLGKVGEWNDTTWNNGYSAYQNALFVSSFCGEIDAAKHFFQKLNSKERTECLVKFTSSFQEMCPAHSTKVLCFLLPFLDKEQEIKIFKKGTAALLTGFLFWPWQTLFMEMANRMFDILSEVDSYMLLGKIIHVLIQGYKDYNYKKLISKFWHQMPKAHKRYVVNELVDMPNLLSAILKMKDLENFFVILKEATADECLKIFSHPPDRRFTGLRDEFYSLPFMTQMYVAYSTESNVNLVEEIKERIFLTRSKEEIEKEKDIWNELFQRLHDHIHKNNKRTIEEERGPIKPMKTS